MISARFPKQDLVTLSEAYDTPYYLTSPKTGDNVNLAFEDLIKLVLEKRGGPIPMFPSKGQAVGEGGEASSRGEVQEEDLRAEGRPGPSQASGGG